MSPNSFVLKMRDAMFSLSRSALVPKTLPDDLIGLYLSQEPSDQMRQGQLLPPYEWAVAVALDAARMYNVDWKPGPEPPF